MRLLNKNIVKKSLIVISVFVCYIFVSCSNSLDSTPSATGRYSVTGKISFAGSSGAVPLILTKDSEGRTATTSFNNAHFSLNLYAYKYGQDGLDQSKKYDNVVVDQSGSFIFCFESKGEYVIYAELIKDEKTCGKGSAYVDVNSFTPKSVRINASPVITENGTIQLDVSTATDITPTIKKVCVSWINSYNYNIEDEASHDVGGHENSPAMQIMNSVLTEGEYNKTFDVVNGTTTISYEDFPGGSWLAKISFDDDIGNTIYSCQEIINVYPNFTTNIWYGSSPAISDGTFTVSKSLVTSYDTKCVPDTNYVLYNNESGNYQYYLKDSPSASVSGTADFSTSTSPSGPSFCFDANGNFYIYDDEKIYTNNTIFSNGFIEISSFPDLEFIDIAGIVIDVTKNVIYLYSKNEMQLDLYKFSDFISNGSTELSEHYSVNYDAGSYFHDDMVINDGILYDLCSKDAGSWIVTTNLGEVTNIHTFAKEVNIDLSTIFGNSSTPMIKDMLYQDGSVYLLAKNSGFGEESIISNGAVLQYNIMSNSIKNTGLSSDMASGEDYGSKKLSSYFYRYDNQTRKAYHYQFFTDDAHTEPLYFPCNITYTYAEEEKTLYYALPEIHTPNALEDNLSTEYFYGPSKFIAIKPKKLVILDEGVALYTDNDALKYKNVNRVVIVDLETFAISAVENTAVRFGSDKSEPFVIDDRIHSGATGYEPLFGDEIFSGAKYYEKDGQNTSTTSAGNLRFGIPCGD